MAIAILVVVVYVAEGPMQWFGGAVKLSAVLCGWAMLLACPLSTQSAEYDPDHPTFNGVNLNERLKRSGSASSSSSRFSVSVLDQKTERSDFRGNRVRKSAQLA